MLSTSPQLNASNSFVIILTLLSAYTRFPLLVVGTYELGQAGVLV